MNTELNAEGTLYRIIEIEWAIKHGVDFSSKPEPIRRKKVRGKRKSSKVGYEALFEDTGRDEDFIHQTNSESASRPVLGGPFGDSTNTRGSQKRSVDDVDDDGMFKKRKRSEKNKVAMRDDEERVLPSTPARTVRNV